MATRDCSRLAWELVAGPRLTLREIDALFIGEPRSRAAVAGGGGGARIVSASTGRSASRHLHLVNTAAGFDDAVATCESGRPIGAVEDAFSGSPASLDGLDADGHIGQRALVGRDRTGGAGRVAPLPRRGTDQAAVGRGGARGGRARGRPHD